MLVVERGWTRQKEFNTAISKTRYVIEQAIANFTTWRCIRTDYRRPRRTYLKTFSASPSTPLPRTPFCIRLRVNAQAAIPCQSSHPMTARSSR